MAEPIRLTDAERAQLLALARDAIAARAAGGEPPETDDLEQEGGLAQTAGVFVSLHERADGALRGCVGSFDTERSVSEAVVEMAAAACSRDPRFDPVPEADVSGLHIEISVLSVPSRVEKPSDVEIGLHGVRIRRGSKIGVLLPQVATRYEWTPEQFLDAVCKKAGIPERSWNEADTAVEVFAAVVFGEDE